MALWYVHCNNNFCNCYTVYPLGVIRINITFCNNSYYALGFSKGYADGVIDGQNKTGNITYEQHYHSSSCYITCTITHTFDYIGTYDGVIHAWENISHSKCGKADETKISYSLSCDTYTESHKYTTCGYKEGQVLSATIVYD